MDYRFKLHLQGNFCNFSKILLIRTDYVSSPYPTPPKLSPAADFQFRNFLQAPLTNLQGFQFWGTETGRFQQA